MIKPEYVMMFSGIIMAIGLGFFIGMLIIQIMDYPYRHRLNKGCVITCIISFIVSVISLTIFIRSCKIYYSAESSHARLLNNLDKAEKGLQKFYIDHPEFKEITE